MIESTGELSATYGPSCPLRAELSATGRVVHGPSCPRAELSGYHPIKLYVQIETYFYVPIGLFWYLFTSFSYSSHLRIKLLG